MNIKISNIQYPISPISYLLYFIFLFFFLCSLFWVSSVSAQGNFTNAEGLAGQAARKAGVETVQEPEVYAAKIVTGALSIVGVIFFMLMVYGGYIWMMAKGDEAEAKKAQNIITMAVIGMVIVIAAYAVTKFVVEKLIGAAA